MTNGAKKPMPLARLTVCALFVALTAVLAQVALPVPFSPVPFTGQVVAVLLTAALLGPKAGVITIAAYLLLGAAGAPVFSMARGGIYMLTGPTGGYLWGFIPAVALSGKLIKSSMRPSTFNTALLMLPAVFFIYLFGALQLGFLMQYGIKEIALIGILPFLPFDLAKVVIAALLSGKIKNSLDHNGLAHLLDEG
jgi:biotin transport system substrate-specific component